MNTAQRFTLYCGLTCLGGSANRQCKCESVNACELRRHPLFSEYRFKAQDRLIRFAKLGEPKDPEP